MFGRAIKSFIQKEVLRRGPQSQKVVTRAILTSPNTFYKHNLADNENDVIVYSPLPTINYPDCSIDQYVWNDFNKWSSKTAMVSSSFSFEMSLSRPPICFRFAGRRDH